MKRNKKSKMQKLSKIFVWVLSALLLVTGSLYGLNSYMKVRADENPPVPERTKKLIDNKDGTYTISLDVTGDADKGYNKANVIIVFDTSSSMNTNTGSGGYTASNTNGTNMYGLVDGEFVALTRHSSGGWNPTYTYTVTDTGEAYTGQRYTHSNNVSRLIAAEDAVLALVDGLLSNNTEEVTDLVQIAFIDFANTATVVQQPTTSFDSLQSVITSRNAGNNNRGTNWEAGLAAAANVNFNDPEGSNDTTYVVFVSDGNPTFRTNANGYTQDWNNSYSVYGNGHDNDADNVSRCYNGAIDEARALVNPNNYVFYTIGTYGSVDRMESLTQYAYNTTDNLEGKYYFSAADTAQLQDALNKILEDIELAGFGSVSVSDGTTKSVTASSGEIEGGLIDVDTSSYKYYLSIPITNNGNTITSGADRIKSITKNSDGTYTVVNDKNETFNNVVRVPELDENGNEITTVFKIEWTSDTTNNPFYDKTPPAATLNSSTNAVEWKLGDDVLYDNVKYTVTFEVWPSQATLDLIADLKNGIIEYGAEETASGKEIDPLVWTYLGEDYSLKTNTQATLSYKDTRIENDQIHTVGYDNPDPVSTSTSELLTVSKQWSNQLDDREHPDIVLGVNRDTEDGSDHKGFYKVALKESNNWQNTVTISTGIMTVKSGVVSLKAPGHDYSFAEDTNVSYHWELKADTVHPMKINGGDVQTLILLDPDLASDDPDFANHGVPANVKSLENNREYVAGSDTYYKLQFADGTVKYYKLGTSSNTLTAVNERRSYLDITKVVTGDSAPEDSEFNFSITVNDSNGDQVWYSVQDGDGNLVFDLETNGNKEVPKYSLDLNNEDTTYSGDPSAIQVGDIITYTYKGKDSTVKITAILGNNKFDFETGAFYVESGEEITVTMMADWNLRVLNLPTGTTYTVTEDINAMDDGYVLDNINGEDSTDGVFSGEIEDANNDYSVVYTNEYTKTKVPVKKVWDDNDNQDGLRDAFIVTLTGKVGNYTVTKTWEVNYDDAQEDEIEYVFEDLDVYDGAVRTAEHKIVYTVEETTIPSGYTTEDPEGDALSGYTITNSHEPEETELTITKVWDDNDDQDGLRPEDGIEVTVKNGDETVVGPMTITATTEGVTPGEDVDGNETWTYTFSGLAKYENGGELIIYTVTETAIDDYTTTIDPVTEGEDEVVVGYTITNTHEPEEVELTITKVWDDNNNQDGKRTATVTVQLLNGEENYGDPITIDPTDTENVTIGTDASGNTTWTYTVTGLPKFENGGDEIAWDITETPVPDYDDPGYQCNYDEETGEILTGFTVTNSHDKELTYIDVTKTWVDNNNQDGIRPGTIKVQVMNGTTPVGDPITIDPTSDDVTVSTDANGNTKWSYRINGLDKYADGSEISYTITEVHEGVITGTDGPGTYADAVSGNNITNTHTPEETFIDVTKTWVDGDDQDGIRPGTIKVQVMNGTTPVGDPVTIDPTSDDVTVSTDEDGNATWSYRINGLAKYENGTEISYTITEVHEGVITGTDGPGTYADSVSGNDITNTHTPEKTYIDFTKAWIDTKDQDGIRPDKITVIVKNGAGETITEVPFEAADCTLEDTQLGEKWSCRITDLDKYVNGSEVTYTIDEKLEGVITGTDGPGTYAKEVIGNNITNRHTPETKEIEITKIWKDNKNQDGVRPDSIMVDIIKGNDVIDTITIDPNKDENVTVTNTDEGANWTITVSGLDKYDGGEEIFYTVSEQNPAPYASTPAADAQDPDKLYITNVYTPQQTSLKVVKFWDDNSNQDDARPGSVTIQLLADGEAYGRATTINTQTGDEWSHEWTGLPKYKDGGVEIEYTVSEPTVPTGYTLEGIEPITEGEGEEEVIVGYRVTNFHELETTTVDVDKIWDDNNDQDGERKAYTLTLTGTTSDGYEYTESVTKQANELHHTFTNLYTHHAGKVITYKVTETRVDGYDEPRVSGNADDGFEVTNHRTPETTFVSGKKVWSDADNLEGYRPEEITVKLLADGNPYKVDDEEVVKVLTEADADENGCWLYSFTDLPKYRDHGTEIVYTVSEDAVDNYTTTYEDINPDDDKEEKYIIINEHVPSQTEITVTKDWRTTSLEDVVDPYGHVTEVEVTLEGKVGENVYYNETVILKEELDGSEEVDEEGNATQDGKRVGVDWTFTFTDLPEFREATLIDYTVTEETDVNEYDWSIESDEENPNDITVVNQYNPGGTVTITGTKVWDDADDQDGERPESITIKLYADGEQYGEAVQVTADDDWTYTFDKLPKQHDKKDIVYTLTEEVVPGYETEIEPVTSGEGEEETVTGYTITNTHTPATVSFKVYKIWTDNENNDGMRPESITVRLLANGTEVKSTTISADDGWYYEFTNLPKYEGGQLIKYTIVEDEVKNYTSDVPTPTFDEEEESYSVDVTNTHEDETINITITKTWDDYDDVSQIRPEEITVDLLADGDIIDTFTITKADGWVKTITGLPKFVGGHEIEYTIYEHEIAEYETKINGNATDGFEIINHHELGRGGDDTPPQTGVGSTSSKSIFLYAIMMIISIIGINVEIFKFN